MDFIKFNIHWYKNRISYYESIALSENVTDEIINEAKILLKFLDDINDEEYNSTYNLFQKELRASKRLRYFIESHNHTPFTVPEKNFVYEKFTYSSNEILLEEYLESDFMTSSAKSDNYNIIDDKCSEILNFSRWIYNSTKPNTAIIFLLRDTLLPYLAFKYWNKDDTKIAVPLLIGRKYLSQFGNGDELYSRISNGIYTALYHTKENSELFQNIAVKYISEAMYNCTSLLEKTKEILSLIKQPEICVVESGVHGTMPLLLKCCDKRVNDIKLFTTLPWLYDSWNGSFYTKHYENLRLFETLFCQDLLFSFSSIKENSFFVREITDIGVKKDSITELQEWNNIIHLKL